MKDRVTMPAWQAEEVRATLLLARALARIGRLPELDDRLTTALGYIEAAT